MIKLKVWLQFNHTKFISNGCGCSNKFNFYFLDEPFYTFCNLKKPTWFEHEKWYNTRAILPRGRSIQIVFSLIETSRTIWFTFVGFKFIKNCISGKILVIIQRSKQRQPISIAAQYSWIDLHFNWNKSG